MTDTKTVFVTNETKSAVTCEADLVAQDTSRARPISLEDLQKLIESAGLTKRLFDGIAKTLIDTPARAKEVRALRVEGYSWRALALKCHEQYHGEWQPPSNQIMGMALCERAAELLGEDANAEPWR